MSATSRALSLHGVGLVLAVPLFFIWLSSPDGSVARAQVWGLLAVVTIYVFVAIMARPTSIYDGAQKVGIPLKGLRFALLAVALVMITAPLLDLDSKIGPIVGLGTLIASAMFYILALISVLYMEE